MIEHFFIPGAQRSSTTYLYRILNEHPEIEMASPLRPEPKFFHIDSLYGRGMAYYEQTYFPGKAGAWLKGEKSTTYLESPKAIERIARQYPKAKLIFLLRDPVRRAISNYRFSVENGLETLSFEEAIEREEERTASFDGSTASVSPFAYLGRGRYADQLAMVGEHFPAAQMQVLVQEQFVANRGAVRALFEFLGVEVGFTPSSIDEVVNASAHAERAEVSAEILARIRSYFREPNARLASEFGADISLWSSESSHV